MNRFRYYVIMITVEIHLQCHWMITSAHSLFFHSKKSRGHDGQGRKIIYLDCGFRYWWWSLHCLDARCTTEWGEVAVPFLQKPKKGEVPTDHQGVTVMARLPSSDLSFNWNTCKPAYLATLHSSEFQRQKSIRFTVLRRDQQQQHLAQQQFKSVCCCFYWW